MSWRRRIPRFYRPGTTWAYSGEAAVVSPQPQGSPTRRVLYAVIVAVAVVAAGAALVNAQRDCMNRWNAVLYRPDDLTAFIMCVRGATIPVR